MLSSLRFRLLVPVLVAVLPTFAIIALWARANGRALSAEAESDATTLARLVAEQNQRSLDAARGFLVALSGMPSIAAGDGATCSASLSPLLAREPVLVNMGALFADGRMFCSAAPMPGRIDLSDRAFYREAIRTGGFGVGEYVVSRVRGKGALGFGYPVESGGRVVAVVYASLDVERLQQDLDGLDVSPGTELAVLDRRGVIVLSRPGGARQHGRAYAPDVLAALRAARGPVSIRGPDGVARTYALRTVTAPDGTVAMNVVAGLPATALEHSVDETSRRALLASAIAALVALAVAGVAAEVLLVRKIRALAETSRRIAAGDKSARTGLRAGPDELGSFVGTFDEMARALEELDREKQAREDQLRQSQKMEVVGRLAGGIAHDFNNFLTIILSAATSVRERFPEGAPGREEAGDVIEAAERAAALTRQLLLFSRRQPSVPRIVDVGATVHVAERLLRRIVGEPISIELHVRAPVHVVADPAQIELVVLNLAVNARDAMPRGGRLVLEVDALEDDARRPRGTDVPPGPLAVLVVRDEGIGMDEQVRARIFEPFFTTKSAGRGTGLGLSTVRSIVEEWGGAIRVDSQPASGTEFRIYLPAAAQGADEVLVRPCEPVGKGTETILVVEDDSTLRATVQRILASHGYRIVEAADAAAALEHASTGTPPDLVLTDVILGPERSGVELARELATRWPGVRVLFMSGYTGDHLTVGEAVRFGGSFIAKPFTPDVLLRAVQDALASSRAA